MLNYPFIWQYLHETYIAYVHISLFLTHIGKPATILQSKAQPHTKVRLAFYVKKPQSLKGVENAVATVR